MELLQQLVEKLGVTESQASGGTGLILQVAKEHLDGADFSKIAEYIPGAEGLIEAAPSEEGGGMMGMLGGIASQLGADKLGDLAGLASGFSKLDMDSGLVQKFISTVLDYLKDKGGDSVQQLLANVLSGSGE